MARRGAGAAGRDAPWRGTAPPLAGRAPGTHQAHVVTAGGTGAGRGVWVQDPVLQPDSARRPAAAARQPSTKADPESRTFCPSAPVNHAQARAPPSSPLRPLSAPQELSWKQRPGASPRAGNRRAGRPASQSHRTASTTQEPLPGPAHPSGPGPSNTKRSSTRPGGRQGGRARSGGGAPRAAPPRAYLDQALQRPARVPDAPLPVLAAGSPRHGLELRGAVPVVPLLNAPAPASWSTRQPSADAGPGPPPAPALPPPVRPSEAPSRPE